MSTDPRATMLPHAPGDGQSATGPRPPHGSQARYLLAMHRGIADRMAKDGSPVQAYLELTRAAGALPMTAALAGALVHRALRAGLARCALDLIARRAEEAEGPERVGVLRQLARVARRAQEPQRRRAALVQLLSERPEDRRARAEFHQLLEAEGRWEDLDAALERETKEALRRGAHVAAARAALWRAQVLDVRLGDPARAALRYMQAAQYAERAGDATRAYLGRLLWVHALHRSRAPSRFVEDALAVASRSGAPAEHSGLVAATAIALGVAAPKPRRSSAAMAVSPPSGPAPAQPPLLVRIADAAERAGKWRIAEVALSVAGRVGELPEAALRLEPREGRQAAWEVLAALHRDTLARADSPAARATAAEQLARVLDERLHDSAAAAVAWAVAADASGEPRASEARERLATHVRQNGRAQALGQPDGDPPEGRALALVRRAEAAVAQGTRDAVAADLAEALALVPGHVEALALLAELAAGSGDVGPLVDFGLALERLPVGARGRGDLHRRFARLADVHLGSERARAAWGAVLEVLPGDEEALAQCAALARTAAPGASDEGDAMAAAARASREPVRPVALAALVAALERAGRTDEALAALEAAVQVEPTHRDVWLLYAERLMALGGRDSDAAAALEMAAVATEDVLARASLWAYLAHVAAVRLGDAAKAAVWAARARGADPSAPPEASPVDAAALAPEASPMHSPLPPPSVPPRLPPPLPPPLPRAGRAPPVATAPSEPRGASPAAPPPAVVAAPPAPLPSVPPPIEPVTSMPRPSRASSASMAGPSAAPAASSPSKVERSPAVSAAGRRSAMERLALFERARANPLEPVCYRFLGDYYESTGDSGRASVMREIREALEGVTESSAEGPPLILTGADRLAMKHPALRTDAGELLALLGPGLCALHPTPEARAGTDEVLEDAAGPGAVACAEALARAVRVLGLPAPEVRLASEEHPAVALAFRGRPRLVVGRAALRGELSVGALRFYAGRALLALGAEMLPLRLIRREPLAEALALALDLARGRTEGAEPVALREALSTAALARAATLAAALGARLDLGALVDGARHTANRAGLLVCGGLGPALAALKAKGALESDLVDLVRFAASERYLQLRLRG